MRRLRLEFPTARRDIPSAIRKPSLRIARIRDSNRYPAARAADTLSDASLEMPKTCLINARTMFKFLALKRHGKSPSRVRGDSTRRKALSARPRGSRRASFRLAPRHELLEHFGASRAWMTGAWIFWRLGPTFRSAMDRTRRFWLSRAWSDHARRVRLEVA